MAKNQLAKKCGVKTGDVIWEAKQKCPQLTIVPPHMEQYLKFSKIVRAIYLRYSPEVEAFGIDESWIEMTGSPLLEKRRPVDVANEIRETVKAETGLTVSIGVSFNKVFAKLGSDMKKPDAVTEIWEDTFRDQVWPLPVSDLLYVGRATTDKLTRYGIHTIGALAKADPTFLERILGRNGLKLWIYANGKDTSRVMPCDYEPPVKSIGHGITCTADLARNMKCGKFCWNSVRGRQEAAQTTFGRYSVRIYVRDCTLNHREYQARMPFPTQSFLELAEAGSKLFHRRYGWDYPVRSLTISAIDLVPSDTPIQLDLWTDFARHKRKLDLERTVEDIRRRFGMRAINFASLGDSLKIPSHREVEYKMPAVMYQ